MDDLNKEILSIAKAEDACRRLQTVPGIGPLAVTAMVAAIGNGSAFRKGRDFSAWLGLVPKQHSTSGKTTLLGISKRGNKYLRRLFIHGARSVCLHVHREGHAWGDWITSLRDREPSNVATVALANKLARIAWSVLNAMKCIEARTRWLRRYSRAMATKISHLEFASKNKKYGTV